MSDHSSQAQGYVDEMAARRGYVLEYHKALAHNDFPVLRAANDVVSAVYLDQRTLSRQTKELLFIVALVAQRASRAHIMGHIRVALSLGVTPTEILEAIEILLPEAGVVVFQEGVEAWLEATDAPRLEPSATL